VTPVITIVAPEELVANLWIDAQLKSFVPTNATGQYNEFLSEKGGFGMSFSGYGDWSGYMSNGGLFPEFSKSFAVAVPEPASLSIIGLGLVVLRRRNKK
jgi:hypothetical protein